MAANEEPQQEEIIEEEVVEEGVPSADITLIHYHDEPSTSTATCSTSNETTEVLRPTKKVTQAIREEDYDANKLVHDFWPARKRKLLEMDFKQLREASRSQVLPLARVKKIMKLDDALKNNGQMISADAPLLLSVAGEMFIEELTIKGWQTTENAKRKTLQKSDICTAVWRNEHMDFLVDVVPRESPASAHPHAARNKNSATNAERFPTMAVIDKYDIPPGTSTTATAAPVQFIMEGSGEMMMRMGDGQLVQATPIGQPIQLPPQAVNQLGVVGLQGTSGILSIDTPSTSSGKHHETHYLNTQGATVIMASALTSPPQRDGKHPSSSSSSAPPPPTPSAPSPSPSLDPSPSHFIPMSTHPQLLSFTPAPAAPTNPPHHSKAPPIPAVVVAAPHGGIPAPQGFQFVMVPSSPSKETMGTQKGPSQGIQRMGQKSTK